MKSQLTKFIHALDEGVDAFANAIRKEPQEYHIIAYRSYAANGKAILQGRVLRGQPMRGAEDTDGTWENVKMGVKRFLSDEIRGMKVTTTFGSKEYMAESDFEGYFHIEVPTKHSGWKKVDFRASNAHAVGEILGISKRAKFMIISDVDDTILETGAANLLRAAKLTLTHNSKSRVAFDGVQTFYQALHKKHNPVFYLSSSPWNLYDFLVDFLDNNDLPRGPLLLTDLGFDEQKFLKPSHEQHKLFQIRKLLKEFDLPVILIGDSGQKDPEIYMEVAEQFADRIHAIYLRDASNPLRDAQVKEMIKHTKVPVIFADHTDVFIEDAKSRGLIN